jgi:regulator of sirC expression with transglutaminase-like and TPR domain
VAALYLGIAEEMRLPVYAVATPAHLFLRFDDGSTRINIEATAMGAMRTDEEYAREGGMPGASLHKGVFLRNLSDDQFLAQVHSNLGVVYSERKNDVAAAREFERALNLDPGLPAAWYNRGNDRLRRVDYRGAVKDFSRALDLYPIDVWALNNRGVAYRNLDKSGKARRDFEAALRIDPGFEPARKNLDALAGRR